MEKCFLNRILYKFTVYTGANPEVWKSFVHTLHKYVEKSIKLLNLLSNVIYLMLHRKVVQGIRSATEICVLFYLLCKVSIYFSITSNSGDNSNYTLNHKIYIKIRLLLKTNSIMRNMYGHRSGLLWYVSRAFGSKRNQSFYQGYYSRAELYNILVEG